MQKFTIWFGCLYFQDHLPEQPEITQLAWPSKRPLAPFMHLIFSSTLNGSSEFIVLIPLWDEPFIFPAYLIPALPGTASHSDYLFCDKTPCRLLNITLLPSIYLRQNAAEWEQGYQFVSGNILETWKCSLGMVRLREGTALSLLQLESPPSKIALSRGVWHCHGVQCLFQHKTRCHLIGKTSLDSLQRFRGPLKCYPEMMMSLQVLH